MTSTDDGSETFTVTSRGHAWCHDEGNCGAMDCMAPAKQRRPSVITRAVALPRSALAALWASVRTKRDR